MNIRSFIRRLAPYRWTSYYRARRDIILFTSGRVFQGPFTGMQYFASSCDWTDCSMLLGLYERELTSIIEQVIGGRWSRFIDLGCAQGYYAVGIALKAGSTVAVIAFDSDPKIVVEARRKAAANKVEDRIVWKGAANAEELERLKLGGQDLLFVDIEGYERELLDPKRIPSLTGCDILVESHDFMYPGTSKLLRERFQASHSITEITWKPVPLEEIPFPESGNAHSLCVNGRPDISWMWMQVREKSSDGKPR